MLQQIVNFFKNLVRLERRSSADTEQPKTSEDYAEDLAEEREKPKNRGM